MSGTDDPFLLNRFVAAQASDYRKALAEIRAGWKMSHWMWFIFPQLKGLGSSAMSREYAIRRLEEARAYVTHPLLGPRLIECSEALLAVKGRTALEIFGSPDEMKLQSSMTLFALTSAPGSVFHRVLDRYYDGQPDPTTVRLIRDAE